MDHPLEQPILLDSDSWDPSDALALIAAPSQLRDYDPRREKVPAIVEAACHGEWGRDEQTVIDVSFALPRNINQRFIRFIRLFNFEVINSSVNRLSSNLVLVEEEADGGEGEKDEEPEKEPGKFSGVQSKVVNKIKPGWRLWMTCMLMY